MSIERAEFIASVVQDERQLDGSWHLELIGEAGCECAIELRLVLDREGSLDEGEVDLMLGGEPLSSVLDAGTADSLSPLELRLSAAPDESGALGEGEVWLSIAQREDGEFSVAVEIGSAS